MEQVWVYSDPLDDKPLKRAGRLGQDKILRANRPGLFQRFNPIGRRSQSITYRLKVKTKQLHHVGVVFYYENSLWHGAWLTLRHRRRNNDSVTFR
jgi:hypothetical protein